MRLSILGTLLASLVTSAHAIYADEAYQIDYHQAYLGIPQQHTSFLHQPTSGSRASLLYTLSEKLILGAVNPKDGAIVWRQSAQPQKSNATEAYLQVGGTGNGDVVISAAGAEVSAWDALDGRLVWVAESGEGEAARDLDVFESVEGSTKDPLAISAGHKGWTLRRLSGTTGVVAWTFEDHSGDIPIRVLSSPSVIYAISLHSASKTSYKTRVTSIDPITGKQTGQYTLSTESDVADAASIVKGGSNSASPFVAWTDKSSKAVKVNILGSKHVSTFNVANDSGDEVTRVAVHSAHHAQSLCHFLVHLETRNEHWAEVYHIDVSKGAIEHAYSLPKVAGSGAFSTSMQDANVYFVRHTQSDIVLLSSASHGVLKRWPVDVVGDSDAVHAVAEVVARSGDKFSVRSALALSSGDWLLVRNGETDWRRYEALSGAVAAQWVELQETEDLAKELEVEGHENAVAAYIHRVKRHAKDLQHFPDWLQSLPARILGDTKVSPIAGLHKDNFGFRKLVAVATDNGHLYALDAGSRGRFVWRTKVVDLGPDEKWHVRGILNNLQEGTITVECTGGESYSFEAATGKILQNSPSDSTETAQSSILVDGEHGSQSLLKVYEGGVLGDLPSDSLPKGDPVLVVRGPEGSLRGMRYVSGTSKTVKPTVVWEFSPSSGHVVTDFTGRPSDDPVASMGRVLGDRSVMYKYLNPNLLLVTTIGETTSTASFHLLDGVSGNTLYSVTHEGVDISRHISSLVSENWFVYSFWGQIANQDAASSTTSAYQLVAAEIFESEIPNDRGPLGGSANFSSLGTSGLDFVPTEPYVASLSFLINQEISGLAVTQTRQGITSRSILATLASSNAIVAIPRAILDPRRPVGRDPTAAEMEEGLGKYVPVIEFDPRWFINHKQEVIGIKNIITTPALLESTSLVFAYGLDIFGTRVAPSMAFDILGKGFAKVQLILTVLGLAVGVSIMAPIVRKKQINARWQVS
ncbi:MAG: hypothetical protein M4579_004178 [Chaenotheca gracillima]|nr:MAG: hypothetical protein M4579_004178 [Chaenotheca gracillima]